MSTVLLVVLILLLLGALPAWPHSRSWGYGPSGLLGLVLVVVLIMALLDRALHLAPSGSRNSLRTSRTQRRISRSEH